MRKKNITLSISLLGDLAMAIDHDDNHSFSWYLDIEKEEVIPYPLEDMDEGEMEEIEYNVERFIPVPTTISGEKREDMRDFISDLEVDDMVKNLLHTNIRGSGAFSRFKDALAQIGKLDEWYEYKNRLDFKKALEWLLDEKLIDKEGVKEGLRLHDDATAKQKQREKDLELMNPGSLVECMEDIGHVGRITIGQRYRIQDERPAHLIIRISNDLDQLKWYPKAHFKLIKEEI